MTILSIYELIIALTKLYLDMHNTLENKFKFCRVWGGKSPIEISFSYLNINQSIILIYNVIYLEKRRTHIQTGPNIFFI